MPPEDTLTKAERIPSDTSCCQFGEVYFERNVRGFKDYFTRLIFFYTVIMTTLGFGDIYANAHNFTRGLFGHVFLAFQVILGYVLLGALVTRFAVLFAAGGPAGKFADEKEDKEK